MKKAYKAIVGTRNRITIPFDCWMNVKKSMSGLNLKFDNGNINKWSGMTGMTNHMSYRVAIRGYKRGTNLVLIPGKKSINVLLER